MSERIGKAFVVQEALGYIIGTVVKETPFELTLGSDAVWVRNMDTMSTAMSTGRVFECHAIPNVSIKDHAIRYLFPWPHKVPK